jgi:hypothetical protein
MLIRIARISLVIALLLLAGCNFPLFSAPAENPGMIYTAAAGTTIAQLTQAAEVRPTITFQVPPSPTGETPSPGELFTPTTTTTSVADFQTSTPPAVQATRTPDLCDRAEFVRDVTIPDNTELAPGETFTKTWRLRNSGTCTWTSEYALVFVDGERMAGPDSQRLTGVTVPPGETFDLSVELEAPEATGTYQGNWQLRNADGTVFGVGSDGTRNFWVRIRVALPGGLALDLIARASAAEWEIDRDGTLTRLAWDGDEDSPDAGWTPVGMARWLTWRARPPASAAPTRGWSCRSAARSWCWVCAMTLRRASSRNSPAAGGWRLTPGATITTRSCQSA